MPGALGYVDTTGVNPCDPKRARALLAEAGVKTPLDLILRLPPPPYARQGGEVIAAQLAQVGIVTRIQNIEWPQWMSGVHTQRDEDLTIISHVEPLDLEGRSDLRQRPVAAELGAVARCSACAQVGDMRVVGPGEDLDRLAGDPQSVDPGVRDRALPRA